MASRHSKTWVDLIDEKHPITAEHGQKLRDQFADESVIHFRHFFSNEALSIMSARVAPLLEMTTRRDQMLKGTPRHISTVDAQTITKYVPEVHEFYSDSRLRKFLQAIWDQQVYLVHDPVGQFVLNYLHRKGDTHGGHLDRHPLALNVILKGPTRGGEAEFVPNCDDPKLLDTKWSKKLPLQTGDAYLLQSDTSVHRVAPITAGERIALSFSYSDKQRRYEKAYGNELYERCQGSK